MWEFYLSALLLGAFSVAATAPAATSLLSHSDPVMYAISLSFPQAVALLTVWAVVFSLAAVVLK